MYGEVLAGKRRKVKIRIKVENRTKSEEQQ